MKRNLTLALSFLTMIVIGSGAASAQLRLPQASQKAMVTQAVGVTDVTITYFRPTVKGRKIWGEWPVKVEGEATLDNGMTRPAGAPIVPYGHVWRTGANAATQFVVTDDVLINGQPLPAGTYSLHSIPGETEWVFIFNSVAEQGGSFSYDKAKDVLRVKAKPEWNAEHQEALSLSVEPESESTAKVVLRWEKLRVPFTLDIANPSNTVVTKAAKVVAAAKADDFDTPFRAASYARDKKMPTVAARWFEQALKAANTEINAGETFRGYSRKFNALVALGRNSEAITAGEKAVALGKSATPKADTATLEKRIADLKAGKN